jgi:hypothetical protein
MLINDWMPRYDFSEYHQTVIAADIDVVYEALLRVDLAANPVIGGLLTMRALPAAVLGRAPLPKQRPSLTLRAAPSLGFIWLEENATEELVLGLTGRFWELSGGRVKTDPNEFRDFVPAGSARVAWNFALEAKGERTQLSTETRILCADDAVRCTFGRYWRVVQPGSGLIRRIMLRMIRREAEKSP